MGEKEYLNLKIAKAVIEAVEKQAEKEGTPVVVAIVNQWGCPIAIHFMDGTLPASFDIALNKAYTSATLRMSTEKIRELSKDGGDLFGINNTNNNKIVAFPGGFPLEINEKVIGGVGVSGGTSKYDNDLAFLAKEIYGEVVRWITMKS